MKSIGRAPLLLNGQPLTEGIARAGDTLCIGSTLVFLVVARPTCWLDAHRHWKNLPYAFGTPDPHGILGESPAMWKLRDALLFAAQSPQHVLVQGESGSGKELIARALHTLSPGRAAPFVARNAATLPEGLADAELAGGAGRMGGRVGRGGASRRPRKKS